MATVWSVLNCSSSFEGVIVFLKAENTNPHSTTNHKMFERYIYEYLRFEKKVFIYIFDLSHDCVGFEFVLDKLLIVFTSKVLGIHAKGEKLLNGIDLLGFEKGLLRVKITQGGFNFVQFGPEVQGVFPFGLLILAITPDPVGNGSDEYADESEFHGLGGVGGKIQKGGLISYRLTWDLRN